MNVYFLVEGKTERKVYPKWLTYFAPRLVRVENPPEASENSYYLISGGGYPSLLDNHLVDAASDVTATNKFDYLVLVLDADGMDGQLKRDEVLAYAQSNRIDFGEKCQFLVVPQVVCMETWFLGNQRVYPRNPVSSEFAKMVRHYNTNLHDPELMPKPVGYDRSIGDFHYRYLKAMLMERNLRYSKTNPTEVIEPYYIKELESRLAANGSHLNSMRYLFEFLRSLPPAPPA